MLLNSYFIEDWMEFMEELYVFICGVKRVF